MTDFPLPLNANETIVKTDEHAAHVKNNAPGLGYNVIYGSLWLTDQRILFRSAVLGNTLSYPLSRVANAARRQVSISQRQSQYSSQSYDAALYVEFDNGGREYFLAHRFGNSLIHNSMLFNSSFEATSPWLEAVKKASTRD